MLVPLSVKEIVNVGFPPTGLGKKSLRCAMPLLIQIGGIAGFSIPFEFYANEPLACGDYPANDISVRALARSGKQRMFGARVLIEC